MIDSRQGRFVSSPISRTGVMPGFDREVVESGGVKRAFEAIYVKLLAARAELMHPAPEDMTPATRGLYELLYASDNSLTSPSHDAGLRSG